MLEAQAERGRRGRGGRRRARRDRGGRRGAAHTATRTPPSSARSWRDGSIRLAWASIRDRSPRPTRPPRSWRGSRRRSRPERGAPRKAAVGAEVRRGRRPGTEAARREPPAEWLARVQARIEELEKRLTAFGSSEVRHVADALSQLRARHDGELVPSPAAQELADQLEVLDAELTASAGVGAASQAARRRARPPRGRSSTRCWRRSRRSATPSSTATWSIASSWPMPMCCSRRRESRRALRGQPRRTARRGGAERGAGHPRRARAHLVLRLHDRVLAPQRRIRRRRRSSSRPGQSWRRQRTRCGGSRPRRRPEQARAERMERRRRLLDDARALLGHPVKAVGRWASCARCVCRRASRRSW